MQCAICCEIQLFSHEVVYLKLISLFLELVLLDGHASESHHQGSATTHYRLGLELPLLREHPSVGGLKNKREFHGVSRQNYT